MAFKNHHNQVNSSDSRTIALEDAYLELVEKFKIERKLAKSLKLKCMNNHNQIKMLK